MLVAASRRGDNEITIALTNASLIRHALAARRRFHAALRAANTHGAT